MVHKNEDNIKFVLLIFLWMSEFLKNDDKNKNK